MPDKAQEYLRKASELIGLLRSPDIVEIAETFARSVLQAVRHYDADTEAVKKVIEDCHELAFLRRDALRSITKLRVDQFLKGEPENNSVRPVYNRHVHEFYNINSLLAASCRMPSGVSLNLIRDPDAYQSYFAFAVRNGGNLIVLSDVLEHTHPVQRYMSRRPDREIADRSFKNWFPYNLLGLKYDEDNERFYIEMSEQTGLVVYQQKAFPLKPIKKLEPREIIWIAMMFDLIVDKFWRKHYEAPQLSYTAEMIKVQSPLLHAAKASNLPVPTYEGIMLKPLTYNDLAPNAVTEQEIGSDGGSPNKWLEERYAKRVTEETLNIVNPTERMKYFLPAAGEDNPPPGQSGMIVTTKDTEDALSPFGTLYGKPQRYQLHALNASAFGTAGNLDADRKYIARFNLAKGIQRLADEEFKEREKGILKWYRTEVEKNKDVLFRYATVEEVWRPAPKGTSVSDYGSARYHDNDIYYCFSRKVCYTRCKADPLYLQADFGHISLHRGWDNNRGGGFCYVSGTASTYRIVFSPRTTEDLAFLTGHTIEELPDVLQHWSSGRDHVGNHLLDRVDPMAWALRNPWKSMNFSIVLYLSIRALRRIEKNFHPPEPVEGFPFFVDKLSTGR
ncbi:MAG: hypothetical protein A4E57_01292 [Syntrophorhabdaceae bacterium PtaU1.Bin034]|nr:MAG: hypothetical protein A4E57_01292 [Syntrophorhabdaceae bacterium PtaU1.Bin034]